MTKVVVTGAFSNIGSQVAEAFKLGGATVHSLTNRKPPSSTSITSAPLRFEEHHLVEQLRGADVFVNTYWVRLRYRGVGFDTAIRNNKLLIDAAELARVGRFVAVSVSNPQRGRNLAYYRGKLEVEQYLKASSLSWAIVRPTLVVGPNDVLSNNIAWFLRNFSFFPMPRGGTCRLQPVTITDTSRIIREVAESDKNVVVDAAGPDIVTFHQYVTALGRACGRERWMPSTPNWFSLAGIRVVEPFLRDVVLTREELLGLQQELLMSHEPPQGSESVFEWIATHGDQFGRRYINDLDRHFRGLKTAPIDRRGSGG